MNKPMTLHEYLEMRNLQRRKELFMINEAKHAPTPTILDKDNKIDSLMIQILDYIRHLINQGPLFSKFQLMMQHLHKLFMRELEEVQKVTVKSRIHSNNKYMDEVKKANQKLNQYIKQCQKQKQEADKKLEKLIDKNKDIRKVYTRIPKQEQKEEIIDHFDDQIVQKPAKIEKITKIDFNQKPKIQVQDKFKKENVYKPLIEDKIKKDFGVKPPIQDKFKKENVYKPIKIEQIGKINKNQNVKIKKIEIDDKFDQDEVFQKPKKIEKIQKIPKIVVNFDKEQEPQKVKEEPKEEYIFAQI